MTSLKQLMEIGLSKRDARSVLHDGEMLMKEIKRQNDRENNILNTELKLKEPF